MRKNLWLAGAATLLAMGMATEASADIFVNGDFETGNINGWTQHGGNRAGIDNTTLSPSAPAVNSDAGRGQIITAGTVDPHVGAALGTTVYNGNYSYRVEDTTTGGFATYIQQTVNNYTDPNVFFAWKAVMLGAHGVNDAATMIISLRDLTSGVELLRRQYNAADNGSGVDARFSLLNNNFYTPNWQIEQLALSGLAGFTLGDTLQLSVLASDCQPTAHYGYVYLDGFGAAIPDPGPIGGVPEPAPWAMMIVGMGLTGAMVRRRRSQKILAAG
jgi:hypothetical protein